MQQIRSARGIIPHAGRATAGIAVCAVGRQLARHGLIRWPWRRRWRQATRAARSDIAVASRAPDPAARHRRQAVPARADCAAARIDGVGVGRRRRGVRWNLAVREVGSAVVCELGELDGEEVVEILRRRAAGTQMGAGSRLRLRR